MSRWWRWRTAAAGSGGWTTGLAATAGDLVALEDEAGGTVYQAHAGDRFTVPAQGEHAVREVRPGQLVVEPRAARRSRGAARAARLNDPAMKPTPSKPTAGAAVLGPAGQPGRRDGLAIGCACAAPGSMSSGSACRTARRFDTRLVVTDPDAAGQLFIEKGIAHTTCELVVVELRQSAEDLLACLEQLMVAETNVDFAYSMMPSPAASRAGDARRGPRLRRPVLHRAGFKVLYSDLSRLTAALTLRGKMPNHGFRGFRRGGFPPVHLRMNPPSIAAHSTSVQPV